MGFFDLLRGTRTTSGGESRMLHLLIDSLRSRDADVLLDDNAVPPTISKENQQLAAEAFDWCVKCGDNVRMNNFLQSQFGTNKSPTSLSEDVFLDIAEQLIASGLDPNTELNGLPLIFSVVDRNGTESPYIRILIENGADLNATNDEGYTALGAQLKKGCCDLGYHFEPYVEHGARLNNTDLSDFDVYKSIFQWGHYDIAKTIPRSKIAEFAKRCDDKTGMTLLHLAAGGMQIGARPALQKMFGYSYLRNVGYLALVELLLDCGADPEMKMRDGSTASGIALQYGHERIYSLLEERSSGSIDEPLGGKGTPLFNACVTGDVNAVRRLLELGADPNVRSFVNYPEDRLFEPGIPQEAGALLFENSMAHRMRPSFFHRMELGLTNLYYPALHADAQISHLLLEAGADPNAICFNGLFPLYVAAEIGSLPIVRDLVEHGAEVDKMTPKGCTAIMNAAEEGKLDIIEYLLRHGADPFIRNNAGSTAIDAARRCGQTAAAQLIARNSRSSNSHRAGDPNATLQGILIDAGVRTLGSFDMDDLLDTIVEQAKDALLGYYGQDVMDALSNTRRTVLQSNSEAQMLSTLLADAEGDDVARDFIVSVVKSYFLIKFILGGSELKVKGLLADGASPIARCRYDGTLHTPIVAAARSGNIEICKLLIEAGADVNHTQSNSETALANASQLGDCDMTAFLLDNGADPNAVTYAGTALAVADSLAIVMILAAWGADPNVADRDGDLPIIGFIDQGEYAIVQALIDLGSDTSHRNMAGETSVEHAGKRGDDRMLGIVLGKERYEPENSVFIPQEFASVMERKIHFLCRLAYPLDVYQDYDDSRNPKKLTQAQEDDFAQALELSRRGLEAKRSGDLVSANDLYIKAFSGDIVPRTANVWGWFQVLLVAKNFRDARLVLRFYHAISASYNCIRRDRGEIDHEIESGLISDCFLTLEFKGYQVLQECMRVWPFDRRAVEDKITTYTGLDPALKPYYSGETPVWRRPYHMSDEEYGLFLRYFVFSAREEGGYERVLALHPDREREFLEAEIRSGNIEAYSSLARLIYEEDEQRAIELCEQAVATYDDPSATFFLAWMLEDSNTDRSKELYQRLVDAGSCYGAANNLANLVKGEDPDRAAELYQKAIDDGNTNLAAQSLADLIKDQNPDRAIELYEMAIDAGNHFWPPYDIANLIREEDRSRAAELYRLSADAGNNFARAALARLIYTDDRQEAIRLCEAAVDSGDLRDGAFFLAWLLEGDDVERSMELYQLCIDSGYCMGAANNLGLLLKANDQERAKQLFELAIESGDSYYATANLADMLAKDSPDRAAQLYQASIDAGNLLQCAKLARMLLDSDRDRARELCEKAVEAGDRGDAAFVLAWLLEGSDSERAKELYQECVDAGNFWGSAFNLARLIEREDPERALELYKMELESTNRGIAAESIANLLAYTLHHPEQAIEYYEIAMNCDRDMDVNSLNSYGVLLMTRDRDKAMRVFRQAIEAGNLSYATCNLGHMLFFENPDEAESLYRTSMEHEAQNESTEAYIGLSLLLKDSDSEQSSALRETAMGRANFKESIEFMAECYQSVNPAHSERLRAMTAEI